VERKAGIVSTINGDIRIDPNQGGRHAGAFKDGQYIRALVAAPGNVVRVVTVEGQTLYEEHGIPSAFAVQTISAERSSFSGKLVLILGGFSPDSSDSRTLILTTDYDVSPPVY